MSGERVPDELVGQAIKEVVMHEVGHTLGLRHNFRSSRIYTQAQHLELEFYDRFFAAGAYLQTHAEHMKLWHSAYCCGS